MDSFWIGLGALVPSIGVGVLFFFAMRFVLRADKNEREQLAELDASDPYVPQTSEEGQGNSDGSLANSEGAAANSGAGYINAGADAENSTSEK